jgi:hypothetical protein
MVASRGGGHAPDDSLQVVIIVVEDRMLLIERSECSLWITDAPYCPALAQKGADLAGNDVVNMPGIDRSRVPLISENRDAYFSASSRGRVGDFSLINFD